MYGLAYVFHLHFMWQHPAPLWSAGHGDNIVIFCECVFVCELPWLPTCVSLHCTLYRPTRWASHCCNYRMSLGSVKPEDTTQEEMLKPVTTVELFLICKDHKSAAELKSVDIIQENVFSSTEAEAIGLIVQDGVNG